MAATTKKTSVQDALANIQVKLNAPKGQYNSFGKYKYRSCEDILAAVKPLLKENSCILTLNDEVVSISDRIYIKATATLTSTDNESIQTTAYAREPVSKTGMDVAQVTGAASSYARKYALNGLFAIDDTKDADALNTSKEYTQSPEETIADAKADANNVKSRADFQAWWSKYPTLQQNQEFLSIAQALGKKFPKVASN